MPRRDLSLPLFAAPEPEPVTQAAVAQAHTAWRTRAPAELRGLLDAVPFDPDDEEDVDA